MSQTFCSLGGLLKGEGSLTFGPPSRSLQSAAAGVGFKAWLAVARAPFRVWALGVAAADADALWNGMPPASPDMAGLPDR